MEPPVSYPAGDSYQGRTVYGKKSGCGKFGCFGIIGAIILLLIIVFAGYFFVFPALRPNSLSGDFLDAVIVPSKNGTQKLWMLTDGSFNFIQTTKSPGRTSTGRECYFCKTWTYVVDPATQKVEKKTKTEYEDIITQINLYYHGGKVWVFNHEYGENDPKVEAFDSETGEKVMDTKQFMAKFPELSAGLATAYFDKKEGQLRIKTKDGLDNLIFNVEDGKLYKNYTELNNALEKDHTITTVCVLSKDDGSGPRKKLFKATGPKSAFVHGMSSLESYADKEEQLEFFAKGIKAEQMTEKIYLEGILYYWDQDCAIVIYLDKLGKKSNRIMTCVDVKTGKEKWTVNQEDMFKKMKIDEEDDTFSSLFFTKDNISVKREGNLVVLTLKGKGMMGYDFNTGKKLWELDI